MTPYNHKVKPGPLTRDISSTTVLYSETLLTAATSQNRVMEAVHDAISDKF